MCHLPKPKKVYHKSFLENFDKENEDPMKVVKEWKVDHNKFKRDKLGMYLIAQLPAPHFFIAAMMCRLFVKLDTTKFSIEWIPLIDTAVNATIMNWANILSNNLAMNIREYKQNKVFSIRTIPVFYMSAYIMDDICFY